MMDAVRYVLGQWRLGLEFFLLGVGIWLALVAACLVVIGMYATMGMVASLVGYSP